MSSRPFRLGFRTPAVAALALAASGLSGACSTPKADTDVVACTTAEDCASLGQGYDCQLQTCIYVGVIGGKDSGSPLPRHYPEAGAGDAASDASVSPDAAGGGPVDGGGGAYEGGEAASDGSPYPPFAALDPHAARRQELLAQYCGNLGTNPCLDYAGFRDSPGLDAGAPPAERVARCIEKENIDAFFLETAMGTCFPQWEAAAACAANTQYSCATCADGGPCALEPLLLSDHGACGQQNTDFWVCQDRDRTARTTPGTGAKCSYSPSALGPTFCFVNCNVDGVQVATASCSGPPEGPTRCTCTQKGAPVLDPDLGTTYYFYGDDCAAVADAMSKGKCLP